VPDERETFALFVSASMEGMTVFAGHEKPWRHRACPDRAERRDIVHPHGEDAAPG